MRIICDHCSRTIGGTVKRLAGNLNLHPHCLAEPHKEAKRDPAPSRPRPPIQAMPLFAFLDTHAANLRQAKIKSTA